MDINASLSRLRKVLTFQREPSNFSLAAPADLYRPLNSNNREIRVLRIDSSQQNPLDIRCALENVSLNSGIAYKALSYEWSPPDVGIALGHVFINSQEVSTTPNLRLALKHLESGPFYWIDALCINQSDDEERGHQVRLMTDIYRNAAAVMVWLGLEEGDSKHGMDFLNEVGTFWQDSKDTSDPRVALHDWLHSTLLYTDYRRRWNGLRQIFQRSYWSRLWVIQELVVPPNPDEVWLLCGPDRTRFTYLRMVSRQLRSFKRKMDQPESLKAAVDEFDHLARRVKDVAFHIEPRQSSEYEQPRIELAGLLRRHNKQICADPRDKVYGLLGISPLYPGMELPISYTIPVLDVYKNVAKYVIRGTGKLDILTYAGRDQCAKYPNPSWIPDWEQFDIYRCLLGNFWSASGSLSCITRFSVDDKVLITQAFLLGKITSLFETGKRYSEKGHLHKNLVFTKCKEELVQWLHFICSDLPNSLSTKIQKAYEFLFALRYSSSQAEDRLPFEKFCLLCEQVSLTVGDPGEKHGLSDQEILNLASLLRHRRHLCAIDLETSTKQELLRLQVGETEKGTGICWCNSRIGDVVAIIRGCFSPLVLHPVDGRYEIVGEIYVPGFMMGLATEVFEEVEIELV